ncbi:protein-L-isoaspartate(D-aspartate) O-methyltransferase [Ulvibacterium marinum]|uniref:protein-L-isoaspartate(D-aspartate) O-methyltransferase n=1 Tax=Ulvibacterium marinum TaxID=2419782 RepID=UPI002493D78D|nr:protein-L-isoaspartate(D-aspartate) O-methyltransferase [Ulvibacterium marinum]
MIFVFVFSFSMGTTLAQIDFKAQREHMVKVQLRNRDITDPATLEAMLKVPRHQFVPQNLREVAYTDGPLPIGEGQTISQPYIVAYMTQVLELQPDHKVLEIGTGSGYQAAVLAEIVDSVYTMEIVQKLGHYARKRLKKQQYNNVQVRIGDGYHGWPEKAPFDGIMVTAGAEQIPPKLTEQLKEGGKMIIPVGPHRGIRHLVLLTKKKGKIKRKNIMAVRFVPFTRKKEE